MDIEHLFPSGRALDLIKKYPTITKVVQKPQIISRLHCKIVNTQGNKFVLDNYPTSNNKSSLSKNDNTFIIDLFENELPDFLVLKPFYENQLQQY